MRKRPQKLRTELRGAGLNRPAQGNPRWVTLNDQGERVLTPEGRPDGVHFDAEAADAIAAWLVPQLDVSKRKVAHRREHSA